MIWRIEIDVLTFYYLRAFSRTKLESSSSTIAAKFQSFGAHNVIAIWNLATIVLLEDSSLVHENAQWIVCLMAICSYPSHYTPRSHMPL